MKICVLNASNPTQNLIRLESDSYVDYRDGREKCFAGNRCLKPVRSWHFWPYALETEFFVYLKEKWQDIFKYDAVIILVNREIKELIPLVKKLKLMKKKVAISFHESVTDMLGGSGIQNENVAARWVELTEIVREADFYLNIFGQTEGFFRGWFGEHKVRFANHGAPIDWKHGFEIPYDQRPYDILIGTRTFGQRIPRNTLVALGVANGLASAHKLKVSYVSEDGDVSALLSKLGLNAISCHQGPFPSWEEWLKFVAQHRAMIHAEGAINLAQIAFDAAMVDVVCIGGTTWNTVRMSLSDRGSSNLLFDLSEKHLLDASYSVGPLNYFKENIHPDEIKKELIGAFKS